MLMHLVNNLGRQKQQEWGWELTSRRGAQWTSVVLPKDFFFFGLPNVRSLWAFKQISTLKVTVNPLCQELNVLWMLCLDIFSKTHEDALSVHNACFVSSISLLVFSFFLCFSRDLYFLLLCTHWSIFFPYLLPSSFPLPFVQQEKEEKKKKKGGRERITSFFSLPFCSTVGPFPHLRGDPLPSHAWTVALCLKMCQKLSSLGHGVFHLCHLYLLGKVPRTFMVLQLLWW